MSLDSPFQDRFFDLPVEVAAVILGCLPLADLLSLRLASRSWKKLIVHNESMIAQHCLQNNPLPPLVTHLYPPPFWADLRLDYIAGLKYRFSVCSKLAAKIANYLQPLLHLALAARGKSLNASPQRRLLMVRRSTALLFLIFPYLENYRGTLHGFAVLSLRESESARGEPGETRTGNNVGNANHNVDEDQIRVAINREIQRQILSSYNDDILAGMARIFCLVSLYLDEKFKRPYTAVLPNDTSVVLPEHIQIATICIGGWSRVLKVATTRENAHTLAERVACKVAEERWYADLTADRLNPPKKRKRWSLDAVHTATETLLGREGRSVRTEDRPDEQEHPKSGWQNETILKSSLSSGPPGQEEGERIPPNEMREMLRWLPRLQREICPISAGQDVLAMRRNFQYIQDHDIIIGDLISVGGMRLDDMFDGCWW